MPAHTKKKDKDTTITKPKSGAIDNSPKTVTQITWPPFEPLCPPEDLELHHLVPNQIVTISNFWTSTLCKKYVSFLNTLPLVTTPGVPKRGEAVRVNDRFQVDDPVFAEKLWSSAALQALVTGNTPGLASEEERRKLWGGEVLGLNPNIRIYRYRKGQFFDQHYDDSNTLTFTDGTASTPARTTWTLLLYLTSASTGCKGGETVFYPEPAANGNKSKQSKQQAQQNQQPITVGLETGMALLHRHGRDCMLHEGREVTEGEKWVIRSDLCVRR